MTDKIQTATEVSHHNMYRNEITMQLASSASEQNVYYTYVCLVKDVKPDELEEIDQENTHIQVERSKAVHEFVETNKRDQSEAEEVCSHPSVSFVASKDLDKKPSQNLENYIDTGNPNILSLTKMKWLTEDQEDSPNSSTTSLSPDASSTCTCSNEYEGNDPTINKDGDKYLSTILRLDREHNMFGLSNITIGGPHASWRMSKKKTLPVFPQQAIIQVCCVKGCCRYKSKTDLPSSLKCGGCSNCFDPFCSNCVTYPCKDPLPCSLACSSCPKKKCSCESQCYPTKCLANCSAYYGMKISLNRKPKYDPTPIELTPRSSSVLNKPFCARPCQHIPQCIPPSTCFPYLMPCFWPSRPSAPCSVPNRCFHNPPCVAPRKRAPTTGIIEICPPKCADNKGSKCPRLTCPGNIRELKQALENTYGTKTK